MAQITLVLGLLLLIAFVVDRIVYRRVYKELDDFAKEMRESNKHDSGDKKGG